VVTPRLLTDAARAHHVCARCCAPPDRQAVELAELLEPMLAWEPGQRPTAAQLLHHKYFQPLRPRGPSQ
jgi:serine/threonine protein kinase